MLLALWLNLPLTLELDTNTEVVLAFPVSTVDPEKSLASDDIELGAILAFVLLALDLRTPLVLGWDSVFDAEPLVTAEVTMLDIRELLCETPFAVTLFGACLSNSRKTPQGLKTTGVGFLDGPGTDVTVGLRVEY